MRRTLLMLAALAVLAAGCRSSPKDLPVHATGTCVCGTSEGDLLGCTAPACIEADRKDGAR